jgi:hypothetical protein
MEPTTPVTNPALQTAQNQSPPATPSPDQQAAAIQATIQAALQPLQQTVAALRQEQESQRQRQQADLEAKRKQELDRGVDLSSLLDGIVNDASANSDDKYDQLKPRQVIDVMSTAFETAIEANNRKIKEELGTGTSEITQQLTGLQQAVMALLANQGIAQAKSQFNDFDQYRPAIAEVIKQYPGLSMEDAYVLAKGRSAGKTPPANVVATERPDSSATRPTNRAVNTNATDDPMAVIAARGRAQREGSPVSGGIASFRSIVSAGLDRALANTRTQ